eukprot:m.27344 g.27344  ORF g.27344 m.27344 type:complete len:68 (+) comp10232_c0_seq1:2033-2236(+)
MHLIIIEMVFDVLFVLGSSIPSRTLKFYEQIAFGQFHIGTRYKRPAHIACTCMQDNQIVSDNNNKQD